jgi:hypothetical protein
MRELRLDRRRKRFHEGVDSLRDRLKAREMTLQIVAAGFIANDPQPFPEGGGQLFPNVIHFPKLKLESVGLFSQASRHVRSWNQTGADRR